MMKRLSSEFSKAYQSLNKEQKMAVDIIEGPVMVVAGPGTGKTQIIALRIANILLNTQVDPSNILALTFTESGARAMRERLASLIGSSAYYVEITTFHSFCVKVMQEYPDYFIDGITGDPLSDLEKLQLFENLINQGRFKILRPLGAPTLYLKSIINSISDLKREGISLSAYQAVLEGEKKALASTGEELKNSELIKRRRDLKKNQELALLYEAYEEYLHVNHRFDFDDMIGRVVKALEENEELLRTLQERYHYLHADEYQDTNSAQNKLLLLLANYWGEDANIFVVGDPDQSIYRFQGASLENQLTFLARFPKASVITLEKNYRSTQSILNAAHALIIHNHQRISNLIASLASPLVSVRSKGVNLKLVYTSTSIAEAIYLAEDIKTKIKAGVKASAIAIIYRNNADSTILSKTLTKYGIAYSVQGGANILDDPTIRNFLKILSVVNKLHSRGEDEDLFTILYYDIFKLAPLDIIKIARFAGEHNKSIFDLISSHDLSRLELENQANIEKTLALLTSWRKFDTDHPFVETFEEILNQSGYLTWILAQKDAHHRVSRLNTLFDEVKRMNRNDKNLNLASFLDNIRIMQENNLRIEENSFGQDPDAVTLTTAHSSKGLEWDHVYLYRVVDGTWGGNKTRELIKLPISLVSSRALANKEQNEDERRLFYVALTRARDSITISYAGEYNLFGAAKAVSPSMFIHELPQENISLVEPKHIEILAHNHLETLLTKQVGCFGGEKEASFLQKYVDKFSLSVTALNTFLLCPYKFKLDKLYKVPHAKMPHLSYGTAVHTALEDFYKKLKEDGMRPPKSYLLLSFKEALKKEILSPTEFELRKAEGEQVLSSYYDFFIDDFREPLYLEKFIRTMQGDIALVGKIDRIEWLDQSERTVRVIDYKTGKSKGITEINRGDLLRQLVFYKLLIDSSYGINFKFGEAVLDFVSEPKEKGKDGKRTFKISDEQVEELKEVIKKSVADIRALRFPRTTNLKTCADCYFVAHCYPEGFPQS